MYLMFLNEREKKLFLGLTYALAVSDGEYSQTEQAVIDAYSHEMKTTFDESMIRPAGEIIDELADMTGELEKRVIIFEAIGLAMTDGTYAQAERQLVAQMVERFDMAPDFASRCEEKINKYLALQGELNALVVE